MEPHLIWPSIDWTLLFKRGKIYIYRWAELSSACEKHFYFCILCVISLFSMRSQRSIVEMVDWLFYLINTCYLNWRKYPRLTTLNYSVSSSDREVRRFTVNKGRVGLKRKWESRGCQAHQPFKFLMIEMFQKAKTERAAKSAPPLRSAEFWAICKKGR